MKKIMVRRALNLIVAIMVVVSVLDGQMRTSVQALNPELRRLTG